jgi:hypothetical protein
MMLRREALPSKVSFMRGCDVTGQLRDRVALRDLMSELSEEAYCAAWHYDTEYALWEILQGVRLAWMRLDGDDARIAALRRLHEVVDGWWRWNPELDDGSADEAFLTTTEWQDIYARTVNDKIRRSRVVIGGKVLRGTEAREAVHRLLGPSLRKDES